MAKLFQWLLFISGLASSMALLALLLVLLPLAISRRTRGFAGTTIYFVSWIWGITLWIKATSVLLYLWGIWGFIIGVVLLGVGSAPVAIIASLIHREWTYVGVLVLYVVAIVGVRMLAGWISTKAEPVPAPEAAGNV